IAYQLAKMPAAEILRTRTNGERDGFLKALIAPDSRILGFTMIGSEAGEVMAVVQIAMQAGLPYTVLRDSVLAHPTMAEGLNGLFSAVKQPQPAASGKTHPAAANGWPKTAHHRIDADGLTIFYREAGPPDAPVVLLLHGFPAS